MGLKSTFALLVITLIQVSYARSPKCNWNYYEHYQQKGCQPVIGLDGCPQKFQCKQLSDESRTRCIHNGKTYKVGQSIRETGPCDSCSCSLGRRGGAFIECASVDCPDWEAQDKSCYMGYRPGTCCPKEICPADGKDFSHTCSYQGRIYKIGEYIQTKDPCKSCICTEEWTNENGASCSKVNCLTGMDAIKIRKGCLPIYNEHSCCSTEMYCDDIYGATSVSFPGDDRDDFCHYQGRYYNRGSTAYLSSDKYQCISCKCDVPPDFTCLRKTCPPKPREDCKTVYGRCCPKYECP